MDGIVREPLEENALQELISVAKDFTLSHGLIVRSLENPSSADAGVLHVPFTLFPSPIPRRCFHQAEDVQTDFNLLMHRISYDREFLADCLKSVIKVDDFTRRIWEIYETVQSEGPKQNVSLAMIRSDYMIDYKTKTTSSSSTDDKISSNCPSKKASSSINLRQIEINTMAASFAGLGQRLHSYHRYILGWYGLHDKVQSVPVNRAADGLAEGIVTAWNKYGNPNAVVLFLTYAVERNIYDHRLLEYSINERNNRIKVVRRSLKDVQLRGRLTTDFRLMVDDSEVALVYQRSCYVPDDFDTEEAWQCRLMMERSRAIVCPNAGYHLAGTKKVQQVLAQPGVVERFVEDPGSAKKIRATFAAQYSLDLNDDGNRNVKMAIDDPSKFVLKPQREGGGNNTFGEEIRKLLLEMKETAERSSYILMERIEPMNVVNYPVKSGEPVELTSMVSELGIYGTLVGMEEEIFHNKMTGYLLRTKKLGTDEGGVATGFSVLDSPFLVD